MLMFDGQIIPGTHGAVVTAPPLEESTRHKYWGVNGELEIVGEVGGRPLWCEIYIHDRSIKTRARMITLLEDLDKRVNTNATLIESAFDGISRYFEDTTFKGWVPDPSIGILPDIAGTMGGFGSYWTKGVLLFYQLKVGVYAANRRR